MLQKKKKTKTKATRPARRLVDVEESASPYTADDDTWPRYISAPERVQRAQRAKQALTHAGTPLQPVVTSARTIAKSFWGKAWCRNLERYSDYASRLPRGRSYLRTGAVLDLSITPGRAEAQVQGSYLYAVTVRIEPLAPELWKDLGARCRAYAPSLLDLLAGKLTDQVMALVVDPEAGLFPDPREIKVSCTCPDWADMCKHAAAVLYGISVRFDERPELLFELRGIDYRQLTTAAALAELTPNDDASTELSGVDLGALFGIDLD